jgi:hypothetical protein
MAFLLTRWLNQELETELVPETLDVELSDGYLFAQLFHQHGLIKDLSEYQRPHANTVEVSIHNFSLLEPLFQYINVPMTAKTAVDVIQRQPGVAVRTVYAIRMSLFALSGTGHDSGSFK